jgi:tryptophan synthase alpha chain
MNLPVTPDVPTTPGAMESHFRGRMAEGRKLLVPYVTGGLANWKEAIRVAAACGADAIEVGIPFSDPVMDGPVIQEASQRSLDAGSTPRSIVTEIATLDIGIPVAVMLYYNTVFRMGHERFAALLADNGVAAAIVPDLPLEESDPWTHAADVSGVETVMLAAPTAPDDRLPRIAARARGFVYAVGLLGITGERDALAATATSIARRVKSVTDKPVLIGVGVSNAEQAKEACKVADGVVQGASVVRRLMEGGPDMVGEYITEVRKAIDSSPVGG